MHGNVTLARLNREAVEASKTVNAHNPAAKPVEGREKVNADIKSHLLNAQANIAKVLGGARG